MIKERVLEAQSYPLIEPEGETDSCVICLESLNYSQVVNLKC